MDRMSRSGSRKRRTTGFARSHADMSNLRIGTSGWSYPSGQGTWNGIFYPSKRGRSSSSGPRSATGSRFDELAFYAEHFDTVEINTTFYGQPKASVARTWADRTPPGFEFS